MEAAAVTSAALLLRYMISLWPYSGKHLRPAVVRASVCRVPHTAARRCRVVCVVAQAKASRRCLATLNASDIGWKSQ
jgi:hypothetical protein